jgi:dTDP-4-amino-4,6-dideoxygalactose transaminase
MATVIPDPVHSKFIPVLRPRLPRAGQLLPYLERIDATRCYSNYGPLHEALKDRLEATLGFPPKSLALAGSGTAALVGAILGAAGRANERKPLAAMPGFTFIATGHAAELCGYRPLLVDVDRDDWVLTPSHILESPVLNRVGLVILVAPFGHLPGLEAWWDFQERTGIPVVVDAAASFEMVEARGRESLSSIPLALSFHATKSFAMAEGGAIVSGDASLIQRSMQALNFGCYGSRLSETPAMNGKLSEYHAAVGLAELDAWSDKHATLQAVASTYRRAFSERGLGQQLITAPDICSSYVLFRAADQGEAERVEQSLTGHKVGFRYWYGRGLHRQPYFEKFSNGEFPVTEELGATLIGLPAAPDLSGSDIDRIADAVNFGTQ